MQGAEKISAAPHMLYMLARNFFCNAAVGMKSGIFEVPLMVFLMGHIHIHHRQCHEDKCLQGNNQNVENCPA
jgi:hypothetical protein